jgi:protein SCO1/2
MTASPAARRALVAAVLALVVALGVAVLAISGGSQTGSSGPTGPTSQFQGPLLPVGLKAADFSLTDVNGHRVRLSGLRGRVVILTFLHSKCQDLCPLTAEDILGALNILPAGGRGVYAVAVTAEPAQDTVASRDTFLAEHHLTGRMAYLNGPPTQLQRVWNAYHVLPVLPGKPDHTAFTILIDKRGIERVGYPAESMTPEALAHDVGVLQRQPA